MIELSKSKLLIKLNSIKRFKDFRNIENIESFQPFLKKKNVKFLKRNRFINFLYKYSFSVRRVYWNRRNQTSYLKSIKNEMTSFIEHRIFKYTTLNDSTEIQKLINLKNIFSKYIQFRMNTLIDFYENEIKSLDTFFNDHFPQDMISPHRKRRVMTYIKRFTITGKKLPSYLIFKSDLLYILTSRKKIKEIVISNSNITDRTKLKLVEKKNLKYYNQTINEIDYLLLRRISSFLETIHFNLLDCQLNKTFEVKLNGKVVSNLSSLIQIGDCIEIEKNNTFKVFSIFQLFRLCLSFKKKKKIILKQILYIHLFLIFYNINIPNSYSFFKYSHEYLKNEYELHLKKNILNSTYNRFCSYSMLYAKSNTKIIPFQFGWINKYKTINKNHSII